MKRLLYLIPLCAIAVLMSVSAAMAQTTQGQTNQNQSGQVNISSHISASGQGSSQDPSSSQAPTSSPDPSTQTADNSPMVVNIESFGFDPADISIAPGTTVTWTNMDSNPHTVTLDDGSLDSEELQPGDSYSIDFGDEPGTWTYHSTLDPDMTGSVTVG